jgi:hypothetical protein
MIIFYFLSDDTMEIRESVTKNSGRAEGAGKSVLFLRRGKVAKRRNKSLFQGGGGNGLKGGHVVEVDGVGNNNSNINSNNTDDEFYTDRDLIVGTILHLNGRPFVICDCDDFTKQYYHEKYGVGEFDVVDVNQAFFGSHFGGGIGGDGDGGHTMFGESARSTGNENGSTRSSKPTSADSFGSGASGSCGANEDDVRPTMTNNIKKNSTINKHAMITNNFKKLIMFDGVCLRYSGILKATNQVDRDRRFVICFYPSDDTISVFEQHHRNSGIKGGKFLEKKRIKKESAFKNGATNNVNDDTAQYYGSEDFYVGAELAFHRHPFLIIGADAFALKFMEQHREMFPKHGSVKIEYYH